MPCTLIATPSCTVVTKEHVSVQSWGQAPKMMDIMSAFCTSLRRVVIASAAKQTSRHCERSEANSSSLRAQRRNLTPRQPPQARPRLHACTTSAAADLRRSPCFAPAMGLEMSHHQISMVFSTSLMRLCQPAPMDFEFVQHLCVDAQSHLCFLAAAQRPSSGEWRRSAVADVVQAWRRGRACSTRR